MIFTAAPLRLAASKLPAAAGGAAGSSSSAAAAVVGRHHRAFAVRNASSLSTDESNKNSKESRREIHSTTRSSQAEMAIPFPDQAAAGAKSSTSSSPLVDRFVVTAEVAVSKIFPAGFGWQASSVVAENAGIATDSLNFALTTGAGDAIGVLAGHFAYYAAKKKVTDATDEDINLTQELQTGILLGSAACCSGTAWQPIVNALQGAELPFTQVFAGTWMGCGLAFYGGLRVARTLLSGPLQYVEEPSYENSKTDASLSAAIGGATGFFVGTDAAYLPNQNFLIDVVGIQDGTPDLTAAAIAGSSTSLGFLTAQSGLNVAYPKGKCWND